MAPQLRAVRGLRKVGKTRAVIKESKAKMPVLHRVVVRGQRALKARARAATPQPRERTRGTQPRAARSPRKVGKNQVAIRTNRAKMAFLHKVVTRGQRALKTEARTSIPPTRKKSMEWAKVTVVTVTAKARAREGNSSWLTEISFRNASALVAVETRAACNPIVAPPPPMPVPGGSSHSDPAAAKNFSARLMGNGQRRLVATGRLNGRLIC